MPIKNALIGLAGAVAGVFIFASVASGNVINPSRAPTPTTYHYGDLDGDSAITTIDSNILLNLLNGKAYTIGALQPDNPNQDWNTCDIDSDMACTTMDKNVYFNYLTGKQVDIDDKPWVISAPNLQATIYTVGIFIPFNANVSSKKGTVGRAGVAVTATIHPIGDGFGSTATGHMSGRLCDPNPSGDPDQPTVFGVDDQCALAVTITDWKNFPALGPTESDQYGVAVESDAPGTIAIELAIRDNGLAVPAITTTIFTHIEVNHAPTWQTAPSNITITSGSLYAQYNGVLSSPIMDQIVACSSNGSSCGFDILVVGSGGAPVSCFIIFTAGAPQTCNLRVMGSDNYTPMDTIGQTITITIPNRALTWSMAPTNITITGGSVYNQTNGTAQDANIGQTLACSNNGTTCGFTVNISGSGSPVNCNVSFTAPVPAQNCNLRITATDNGSPALTIGQTIFITIVGNHTPTWQTAPSNITITGGSTYNQTNGIATDIDAGQTLSCSLVSTTCSFGVTVSGSGPNTGVNCNINFSTGNSTGYCSVIIQVSDGAGGNVTSNVNISIYQSVSSISAGFQHNCILTMSGVIECWGLNSYGQLGDNTTTSRHTPVYVNGLSSGVVAIAGGGYHTCALTTAGGVKCWGYNYDGELGDNTSTDRHTPVDVYGLSSGVASISAGFQHTCILTMAGGIKCWGLNNYGQLGDNTTTSRYTPVDVVGLSSGVAVISGGGYHTCAITTAGGVKCWGYNYYGEIGDNTTTNRKTPVDVVGLSSGVAAISGGGYHTCAITTTGGVKCWGRNTYGQLGDNTTTQRNTPVDVVGLSSGVGAISAGWYHTSALTTAGGVKCWGYNYYGEIGDNTATNRYAAVDVVGLSSGVAEVSAGGYHTCALTTAGVKCWGYNYDGELGDNTTTNRLTPVDLVWANHAPTWRTTHSNITITGGSAYNQTNGVATDVDTAQTITCSINGTSCGFTITVTGSGASPRNCNVSFTAPVPAQTCNLRITATDNGTPSLSVGQTISINNHAPTWQTAPTNITITGGSTYNQTNGVAQDEDAGQTLTCSNNGTSCGFAISVTGSGTNPQNCDIIFKSPLVYGTCDIRIMVVDNEIPSLSVGQTISISLVRTWSVIGARAISNGSSSYPSLAIDSSGNPVVAWVDFAQNNYRNIYIKRWDGNEWIEIGTGSASGGGISGSGGGGGIYPSLALDTSGNPVVAWVGSGGIYIKRWNGSAWEEIGAGSASGGGISSNSGNSEWPSLVLDSSGSPVVAWYDYTSGNNEIYIKRWNPVAGTWNEIGAGSASGGGISNNSGASGYPSLALDPLGNPVVAWHDSSSLYGNFQIYIKRWTGSAWVDIGTNSSSGEGISETGSNNCYPSLYLDASGNPFVAWTSDNMPGCCPYYGIYIKRWNPSEGGIWEEIGSEPLFQGISDTIGDSRWSSLALDSAGNPFVAWEYSIYDCCKYTPQDVYIKSWNGSTWKDWGIIPSSNGGISAIDWVGKLRLALDHSGNPVIALDDGGQIYVKRWQP